MTETERNLDLLLGDALAENERLKRELKYQDAREGHIGTHLPRLLVMGAEALRVRAAAHWRLK